MLFAIIVCAELFQVYAARFNYTDRSIRAIDPLDPGGCYHEGRWHAAGAPVRTRAACLRCTCARGVLACARRACAPLPDPPPRCHVLHRKGSCCPELHCPDGVKLMELGASARFEDDDYSETTSFSSVGHARFPACVEGGSVFGAGSALAPGVACEQCFCLGGARRCVRPTCLPPPRGCVARPAPGACCPQRYYCSHEPLAHGTHDCKAEDTWYKEGERIQTAERACTQCFCLRGAVRCQPLSCAPPLLGCKPLLRPGECCPHQYHCEHADKTHPLLSSNSLISVRNDDRSLHTSESNKVETTTQAISTSTSTKDVSTSISSTKTSSTTTLATEKAPVSTSKVKRKTDELHANTTNNSVQNVTSTTELPSTIVASTTEKLVRSNFETSTMDVPELEDLSEHEDLPETTSTTEQPEGSVRIVINGTINCTAELSSTSLPLNLTVNNTERIKMEAQPRIPILTTENIESHTFNPIDIITDRSVNGEFDDNEMFTINVTSSLSTNSSRVTSGPPISTMSKIAVPTDLTSVSNMSKKTNEFDFDYAEPTLPPSLPNLKIIPFVAADAVVDEESPKEVLTYPILEREDKYPVYYPTLESKDTPFASRREDIYHPTQYPVFTSEKVDTSHYPALSHEIDITSSSDYPTANNNLLHEQTVSASLGSHALERNKAVTKLPSTSTTFKLETPSINLFSPPVETEGGFIPKGPGIIDEYYAVYPSTPSAPSVPHMTTSMQLDTGKDCLTADGHRVLEGTTMDLMCSVCSCTWGKIHCSPRACLAPDGCYYNPELHSSTADVCCGELVCVEEKETTTTTKPTTTTENILVHTSERTNYNANKSVDKITTQNKTMIGAESVSKLENENSTNEVATTVVSQIINNDKRNISTTPVTINTPIPTEATFTSPSTSTAAPAHEVNQTHLPPQDYEEEDDDEGFSFGSVLKLLLSDSYDATTAAPQKKKPVITTTKAPPTRMPPTISKITPPVTRMTSSTTKSTTYIITSSTTKSPTYKITSTSPPTSSVEPPKTTVAPFVPMPHHYPYPYAPPKKTFQQNTVNRIDHLVLGEATAIRKPTPRPLPFKPVSPKLTTHKPTTTTRKEIQTLSPERAPANVLSGVGGLKLAGCNIYGRMYRVGRIIAELSTPCQECRCTEFGVQCRPLAC